MKLNLKLFGKEIAFLCDSKTLRDQWVTGYTNRCKNGRYCIFLDYDNVDLNLIKPELEHLQINFNLSSFYIFQSSENSYHAVCFDKVNLHEYIQILRNSSVDPRYIDVPLNFGKKVWSLRLSDKDNNSVTFLDHIHAKIVEEVGEHKTGHRTQSTAHANILNNLFKLNIKLDRPDNEKDLILCRYRV